MEKKLQKTVLLTKYRGLNFKTINKHSINCDI